MIFKNNFLITLIKNNPFSINWGNNLFLKKLNTEITNIIITNNFKD